MTEPHAELVTGNKPAHGPFNVRPFTVVPAIPEPLRRLSELAYNLWWTWNTEATELFRRLDFDLWEQVAHNPVQLLGHVSQERLADAAEDEAYLAHLGRVMSAFDDYMSGPTWFDQHASGSAFGGSGTVAYFSPEFGLHESLPVYSGGLGVLAGDHLKSASDLGLPLVGVGLLYKQGYFHQYLSTDGWQFEEYPSISLDQMPMRVVRGDDRAAIKVRLKIGRHDVCAQLWEVKVGRVRLFLLDSDVPENRPEDRRITGRLYGGDQEARIRQEILLGVGGLRALNQMGIEPAVCHMNEGHSAFLSLERIRTRMKKHGLSFAEAKEAITAGTVFTTHTAIPAGIDTFPSAMVAAHLGELLQELGIDVQTLLEIGRAKPAVASEPLSMAVLALRLAGASNAVSDMHGEVSRGMWTDVWPHLPREEVPIRSITNGVHTATWQAPDMAQLFDRYLGPKWRDESADAEVWQNVDKIPDAELWRTHERLRTSLVVAARQRLRVQRQKRGAPPAEVAAADEALDPEALTIGFARRFARYKRAALFLRNHDRLVSLLTDPERPVQIIVAGKAHPKDTPGKELIKQIAQFARTPEVRQRIVFLEDYDISLARRLVQGVDVWLNNPLKLHEASGTSGMKVAPNGGINLSILDGWWPEAYDGGNGWAIGDNRIYDNEDYQNFVESEALYDLLEKEVIPLFFERGSDGLPKRWIAMMKASIASICAVFNSHRMVREYATRMYIPASQRFAVLGRDGFDAARQLSAWKQRLRRHWDNVRVEEIRFDEGRELIVDHDLQVEARVRLDEIDPRDVVVQLYHGALDGDGQIHGGRTATMSVVGTAGDGVYLYRGRIPCKQAGRHGFAVRILARHENVPGGFDLSLVRWA